MKKILLAAVMLVIALTVLNLTVPTGPDPDVVYPIANHGIWN